MKNLILTDPHGISLVDHLSSPLHTLEHDGQSWILDGERCDSNVLSEAATCHGTAIPFIAGPEKSFQPSLGFFVS